MYLSYQNLMWFKGKTNKSTIIMDSCVYMNNTLEKKMTCLEDLLSMV